MTAVISFLSSALFRWLLEKVFGIIQDRQDHRREIEMMEAQDRINAADYARKYALVKAGYDFAIDIRRNENEAKIAEIELDGWVESQRQASRTTGIEVIDAWNGGIRPFVASVCVLSWLALLAYLVPVWIQNAQTAQVLALSVTIIDFTLALIGTVLGWYFGSRSLMPGKK